MHDLFRKSALLASALLYAAQVGIFIRLYEQIIYGVLGFVWFFLVLNLRRKFLLDRLDTVLLSLIASFGIGFVPHRLRLGVFNSEDFLGAAMIDLVIIIAFPIIHFLLTMFFLSRKTMP